MNGTTSIRWTQQIGTGSYRQGAKHHNSEVRNVRIGINRSAYSRSDWKKRTYAQADRNHALPMVMVTPEISADWKISNRNNLSPNQKAYLSVLEQELSNNIEKFDFGEVMADQTVFISLLLSEEIRVNVTVYEGDFEKLYLTFFSRDTPIRQDILPFINAIAGIRKVYNHLDQC